MAAWPKHIFTICPRIDVLGPFHIKPRPTQQGLLPRRFRNRAHSTAGNPVFFVSVRLGETICRIRKDMVFLYVGVVNGNL